MPTESDTPQLWIAVTARLELPPSASINDVYRLIDTAEIGRTTLARIRRGEGSTQGATLNRLAKALKCEPGDLLPKSYAGSIGRGTRDSTGESGKFERDTVPFLSREVLMKRVDDLPEQFWMELLDDALGSKVPRGTRAKFTAGREPTFGDVVLIHHPTGGLHVRVMSQSIEHGWIGTAVHSEYEAIQGNQPGLRILAVFTGVDAPWSQLFA